MFVANNLQFEITELDGEYFYQCQKGRVHPRTLKKVIRDLNINENDIRVFEPEYGVFSIVGKDSAFWSKIRMTDDVDQMLDMLFEKEAAE